MSKRSRLALTALAVLVQVSPALAAGTQGSEPNSPLPPEEPTKTRTQLFNELNLRTAQVDLEHAKEAYERYEAEHKEAQVLFKKGIMSRKELDEAVSAYARAAQQLKQAEILLEKTRLSFLANATHITMW
jgi:exonuclease VII small subunit